MAGERLTGDALALRDLALVVREDEVGAAAVEIDGGAELVHRHHRAFDVPTGAADAEGRAPRRLVGERRLPEHEVEGVAAVGIVGVAAAGPGQAHHVVAGVVRHLAEPRERRHVEVDGAVGEVGVAVVEERVDHVDHAVDRLGGAGLGERRTRAQRLHVGTEPGQLGLGQVEIGHAELAGLGEDGVVDVGDVAHHAHLVAELFEPADEEVVREVRGGVAEVRGVVRRDAAHVHAHDRADLERDDGTLGGVEEPDGHGAVMARIGHVGLVTVWGCGGVRSPRAGASPRPCGGG